MSYVDFKAFSVTDWVEYTQQQHARSIDMTLARVTNVWQRMNIAKPPVVITVGGTNGKGSSVSLLTAVLHYAGYRVGSYTSPHLVHFNERICVNQKAVDDAAICAGFCAVEAARSDTTLTYFEYATLCALSVFHNADVDVAVLEVGMGGRLDAVNILDNDIALITSVGFDHMQWLGTTIEAISREKAGIFKPDALAVYASENITDTMVEIAAERNTQLYQYQRHYRCEQRDRLVSWQTNDERITADWRQIDAIDMPLAGAHQMRNLAGVIMVLALMQDRLPLTTTQLKQGIKQVKLAGRCQILSHNPMIIVDVAHNLDAVAQLADFLQDNPVSGKTVAIFAALEDKAVQGMLDPLLPQISEWYFAGIEGERGQSAQALSEKLASYDLSTQCKQTVNQAYDDLLKIAKVDDRIVIFGSFHIVGDILARHELA